LVVGGGLYARGNRRILESGAEKICVTAINERDAKVEFVYATIERVLSVKGQDPIGVAPLQEKYCNRNCECS
jgi:hypothetical protein